MAEQACRIPARSRREAMDWSLVLASQDIATTIDCSPEEADWGLLVHPQDYPRARETLDLYRLENRHWAWRKQVLRGGLLFDWTSLLWVLLLCVFYAIAADRPGLREAGMMEGGAVSQGQFWRLFTAMWLHADLGHLASNAALGIVLLGLAMGRFGTGVGLLGAYLAGLGGNLAVWLLSFGHASLGASGLVMGCLGLVAASTFFWERRRPRTIRYVARGVLAGALLFVLLGLSPETDVRAHIGGFVSGVVLGILLNARPKAARNERLNLVAGAIFTVLVILPWGMAFLRG
jgi:rhomboid protease GluP